jgi:hypothetical protein
VMEANTAQPVDDVVRSLPGNVGDDQVTRRSYGSSSQYRETTHRSVLDEDVDHIIC